MVLDQVGVLNGGFTSKTTVAVFWITVPVVTVGLGFTVNNTLPSALGGRKPASGSMGGRPVTGSRDWKVHVRTPVEVFREALIFTKRFVAGRRSTVVVNAETDSGIEGGVMISLGNVIGPNMTVVRSKLALSVSVTVTDWAGAVAVGLF